jgi:hypothetical protein
MADGSNHKSINNFTLYNVMKVAIDGADRPSTNDVLEQLLEVINHTFDFRKKVRVNMELMQSNTARMATYGIVIGIPQLMLTLLANIKTATKSDYGCEFCSAMHAICKKYMYNHVHDGTSLQTILMELAGADGVRALKDAPAPNAGTAHSVADSVSFLNTMMNGDTNSEYNESAYGASSDSSSSEEWRKYCKCKHKKTKKPKSCKKKKKAKDKDDKPKKNTCPHCKKYHRRKSHRAKPDKCMWNKKYKGYHFKSICNELKVEFKPCIKFMADLGGYAEKEDSGSK